MAGPIDIEQPGSAGSGNWQSTAVAFGFGILAFLALIVAVTSDDFMRAQQAMFDAMAAMAEACRL